MADSTLRGIFRASVGFPGHCLNWCRHKLFNAYCHLFVDAPAIAPHSLVRVTEDVRHNILDNIGALALNGDISSPGLTDLAQESAMHIATFVEKAGGQPYAWRLAAVGIVLMIITEAISAAPPHAGTLRQAGRSETAHTLGLEIKHGHRAPTHHYL